jgi:hypothetical protein
MKRCSRCGNIRQEGSFYTDGSHRDDWCKACIHHPRTACVKAMRHEASKLEREQAAIRHVVKHAQADQPFVYLIRAGSRNYKIGTSMNVNKRLRQLATASSKPIQLIAVAPGGRQLEQDLHRELKRFRIRLEWFRDAQNEIVQRFAALDRAMVFLPGYVTQGVSLT